MNNKHFTAPFLFGTSTSKKIHHIKTKSGVAILEKFVTSRNSLIQKSRLGRKRIRTPGAATSFNEILGIEVNVPEKPQRIVSLSPAITETLFMLGLGERVIGVSAFCARPPEARKKRKFGSYSTVNTKLLESTKPDLVFAITGYQKNLALDLNKNFTTYPLELPTSVAGIIDMVTKVGLVTGEHEHVRALSSGLMKSLSKIEPISKRIRVLVEIDLGGPVSFGAFSYITDAINLVGASSIYDNARSEWTAIDLTSIPKENPEVFIYEAKMYSHFAESDLDALIKKRGWDKLDFVKKRKYFLTPGPLDFLAHHGPSFITDSIPWFAEHLDSAIGNPRTSMLPM